MLLMHTQNLHTLWIVKTGCKIHFESSMKSWLSNARNVLDKEQGNSSLKILPCSKTNRGPGFWYSQLCGMNCNMLLRAVRCLTCLSECRWTFMRKSGVSHLFLVSGTSNLPARSLNMSGLYFSASRSSFQVLQTSAGTSECMQQYLVLAAFAIHQSSYLQKTSPKLQS